MRTSVPELSSYKDPSINRFDGRYRAELNINEIHIKS